MLTETPGSRSESMVSHRRGTFALERARADSSLQAAAISGRHGRPMPALIAATVLTAVFVLFTGRASASDRPIVDVLVSNGGPTVSVVVRTNPGAGREAEAAVAKLDGTVQQQLPIIGGFSATIHQADLAQLKATGIFYSITDNAGLKLLDSGSTGYSAKEDDYSLYNTSVAIGVREMWKDGASGRGVDVALIDSGVAPVAGLDRNKIIWGPDLTNESQNPATARLDTFGHGTHMAGIIAGHDSGYSATEARDDSRPFMGIAPDAQIVSVKVADAHGMADVSQVIAGVSWVVQHAHDPGINIRVLNLSFGTDSTQPYTIDPLAFAVEVAWRSGIVVVVSAGNNGLGGLTMPAADPFVLAVGAADLGPDPSPSRLDRATVPAFSSRGTGTRNPDVVAPGVHVQSLRVPGSYIDIQHGVTGKINERFFRGTGTSQAAAMVSGSAAVLLSQRPYLSPDQVKSLLRNSATYVEGTPATAQGKGVINMRKVEKASVVPGMQTFARSTGTGSLDAARGTWRLSLRGVELNGERDIFGRKVDTAVLAAAEAAGSSWSGGTWNGSTWSGSSWSGSSWSGSSWSGSSWSGRAWSVSTWSGNDWTGSSWSTDSWATGTWNGSSWSASSWSGSTWSGSTWSGDTWSGSTWSDESWTGGTPSHSYWDGATWK